MKCSNCSNDMIQSKAGWLCMECGHIEMLSTDDKAKMAAAAPPPPAILGHASPVPEPAAAEPTPAPAPPETEPEPAPAPAEPEAPKPEEIQIPEVVEAPEVSEEPEEPEEPEKPEEPEEPKADRKRLRNHHTDHAGLAAHSDMPEATPTTDVPKPEAPAPDAPTPDAPAGPIPVPVIDVASVVGDAEEPESTVIDITPAESPEKVLEESIAEIQTDPEAEAETDTQLEPQTALSSSPAVAAAIATPVAETPAASEPKPPLQPETHPGSVASKSIGVIAVVVVSLSVLGGAAVYASVTKSPALSWLTGSKPSQVVAVATPAQTAAPTSTPVLAAEVTPAPSPAVPVNRNAQRIDDLAAYKAAYLATAKNGFFPVKPPSVSVQVTEPSTGLAYVVSKAVPTALGQIQYWPGGVCSGAPKTPGATGTKYLALQVMLEGSTTPYCVEVK